MYSTAWYVLYFEQYIVGYIINRYNIQRITQTFYSV